MELPILDASRSVGVKAAEENVHFCHGHVLAQHGQRAAHLHLGARAVTVPVPLAEEVDDAAVVGSEHRAQALHNGAHRVGEPRLLLLFILLGLLILLLVFFAHLLLVLAELVLVLALVFFLILPIARRTTVRRRRVRGSHRLQVPVAGRHREAALGRALDGLPNNRSPSTLRQDKSSQVNSCGIFMR
eukprot:jgi/Chrpa1/17620/Chrysochromulina_OHIO_Genome00009460-RA